MCAPATRIEELVSGLRSWSFKHESKALIAWYCRASYMTCDRLMLRPQPSRVDMAVSCLVAKLRTLMLVT